MDTWAQNDLHSGEVVAFPTNLGWMMGPFVIFAALLDNATMALFEARLMANFSFTLFELTSWLGLAS